jgi:hypothetical protein
MDVRHAGRIGSARDLSQASTRALASAGRNLPYSADRVDDGLSSTRAFRV